MRLLLPGRVVAKLPEALRKRVEPLWVAYEHSYSQYGEDSVARAYFDAKPRASGFYVDIGAHHPTKYSNTYFFYRRGWSGINIDATPGSMGFFREIRPRDINLEIAVGAGAGELTFFVFDDHALENTANPEHAAALAAQHGTTPRRVPVRMRPLSDVLAEHLPATTTIDLLSVDVEGLDVDVLRSNDWDRFRPELILVESFATGIEDVLQTEVYGLMRQHEYRLYAWAPWTLFFVRADRV
jgi:FkbM family methyltransferase